MSGAMRRVSTASACAPQKPLWTGSKAAGSKAGARRSPTEGDGRQNNKRVLTIGASLRDGCGQGAAVNLRQRSSEGPHPHSAGAVYSRLQPNRLALIRSPRPAGGMHVLSIQRSAAISCRNPHISRVDRELEGGEQGRGVVKWRYTWSVNPVPGCKCRQTSRRSTPALPPLRAKGEQKRSETGRAGGWAGGLTNRTQFPHG
jgi:hypothetical protein